MAKFLKKTFILTNFFIAGAFGYGYYKSSLKSSNDEIQLDSNTAAGSSVMLSNKNFYHLKQREQHIQELKQKQYDMLVIGGGCHGAGVFLDGITRGLKCALIEMNDFSSGCSSRSSKMAHGGLRYMQQIFNLNPNIDRLDRFNLLTESIRERTNILENSFFLSHKIPLVIPCTTFQDTIKIYCGLLLYHLIYQFNQNNDTSVRFSYPKLLFSSQLLEIFPNINNKFKYAVIYEDGQFNDARLNLELVLTGTLDDYLSQKQGGNIANYVKLVQFNKNENGTVVSVKVEDLITKQQFEIKTNSIVNCAGNWTDQVQKLSQNKKTVSLDQLLSTHVMYNKNLYNRKYGICFPGTSEDKILYMYPYLGKIIIGSLVDLHDKPEQYPKYSKENVRKQNEEVCNFFSKKKKEEITNSITAKWGGLGYCPFYINEKTNKRQIISNFEVRSDNNGVFNFYGGNWTCYRQQSETTVNKVVDYLKKQDLITAEQLSNSSTIKHRLSGELNKSGLYAYPEKGKYLDFYLTKLQEQNPQIDHKTAKHLIKTFGDRSFDLIKLTDENPALLQKIHPNYPYILAEITYCIRNEMAINPIDFLFRRISLGILDEKATKEVYNTVLQHYEQEFKQSNQSSLKENLQTISLNKFYN